MLFGSVSKPSWSALVAVVALHAAALAWLLQQEPARQILRDAAPMFVDLVIPPEVVNPKPTQPPKAHPQRKSEPDLPRTSEPLPLLASANDAPSPSRFEAPRAEPAPLPPIQAASVREAPQPTAPVIPPNFSAAYLDNPPPAYPTISRRMGEQGKVLLRVLVSAEGRAERVELNRSSGSSRLDQAALEAVRRWRFVPARQGVKPLSAWVLVPISFHLEG